MAQKPAIPKGTRDFLPTEVAKRNHMLAIIKEVFRRYGYAPIETPSFELSTTLLGKYGDEGDRLIFRILNSGEKMRKADLDALSEDNLPRFANSLAEKALRYDLTVPFARFVVQHQNELTFPFKRYQIQPVWRADRPQHGRYQEFTQCDVDVVGSDALLYEVELIQIFDEVLSKLGLPGFSIQFNNRKILSGIAEICGEAQRIVDMTVAIDKLDKIGEDGVITELEQKGFSAASIEKIKPLFAFEGSNDAKLKLMRTYLAESEIGQIGLDELTEVLEHINELGLQKGQLVFDLTLARGLNYYTGAIFEVKAHGVKMGSICGGGRYDDLTALFGLKGLSGVGISFGADRIYDVMSELDLFPKELDRTLDLLFVNFGMDEAKHGLKLVQQVRNLGLAAELYPSTAKLQKQLKYANDRKVPYVVIIGAEEAAAGMLSLKNMETGAQEQLSSADFLTKCAQLF
ncbi:MAG: histidine--tRNA ligase [Cryomorphaceae bacterium]|jgi:histidyl-tRNA synthetase|nr:histidine--tRNA ligase [Cryomorphaceae bacterium]